MRKGNPCPQCKTPTIAAPAGLPCNTPEGWPYCEVCKQGFLPDIGPCCGGGHA